jgi:hypothetical protein
MRQQQKIDQTSHKFLFQYKKTTYLFETVYSYISFIISHHYTTICIIHLKVKTYFPFLHLEHVFAFISAPFSRKAYLILLTGVANWGTNYTSFPKISRIKQNIIENKTIAGSYASN